MKSLARSVAARSLDFCELALLGAVYLLCSACESSSRADPPRPSATAEVHPPFPLPKTPEMLAEPVPNAVLLAKAAPGQPQKSRDKKDWQANCKIQQPCSPEPRELPTCDAQAVQRPWVDAVTEGDALIGKEVSVSGTVGLSLIKKTGSGTCAPGACCHTLEMQIVLVGEPTGSLPLHGLTCSGDDSTLCCSVPAEGQSVIARGRLQKLTSGVSKWQLNDPTLCVIDNTPRH
ncbi:MAG TPA: hypothetical protein VFK05_22130 [Polyangiaceae bacterium]|nr:hypothetical protein [Polyangiaceae bacterium]